MPIERAAVPPPPESFDTTMRITRTAETHYVFAGEPLFTCDDNAHPPCDVEVVIRKQHLRRKEWIALLSHLIELATESHVLTPSHLLGEITHKLDLILTGRDSDPF